MPSWQLYNPDAAPGGSGSRSMLLSRDWLNTLQGAMNATNVIARHQSSGTELAINILSGGPFRIGFVNFPGRTAISPAELDELRFCLMQTQHCPDMLRICISPSQVSLLSQSWQHPPQIASWITDFQNWQIDGDKKRRKDVKAAHRMGLKIRPASVQDSAALCNLYLATLVRNGGQQKYKKPYFKTLVQNSLSNPNVSVHIAYDPATPQQVAGFCAAIANDVDAYYLHGAFGFEYRNRGVSDLLLETATLWAQTMGAKSFDMLSSPASQPGLVRFKEKWGAASSEVISIDIAIRPIRARLLRLALLLHNKLQLLREFTMRSTEMKRC